MNGKEATEIPFGANDSELKGWEYTIPEGMEAEIKDGKIIVREKESEDERIRKKVIEVLKLNIRGAESQMQASRGVDRTFEVYACNKAIAWLEKKDEHIKFLKSIQIGDEVTRNPDGVLVNLSQLKRVAKQGEQNLANSAKTCKVEPKLKVGVWLVCCDYEPFQIIGIRNDMYKMSNGDIRPFHMIDNNHNIRLWTIQDAKDGDILYTPKGLGVEGIFLVRGWQQIEGTGKTLCSNIGYRVDDDEIVEGGIGAIWWEGVKDPFFPATKEQRDLLFQKMKEAGYEWNAEKKELRKIEKNPAWSKEDEKVLGFILTDLELLFKRNRKSIALFNLETKWLKALKDRYTWKPSDEQMYALQHIIACYHGDYEYLADSLYNDLKKIKG